MRRFIYEAGVIVIILVGLSIFKWFDGGMGAVSKNLLEQPVTQIETSPATSQTPKTLPGSVITSQPESAPSPGTEGIASAKPESAQSGQMVNVNTADQEQLMRLNGIGEVIATRIIDYRNQHGPFTCEEDLLEVKGIGEKKLEKIRKSLVFP